jgi:hypothetical protein
MQRRILLMPDKRGWAFDFHCSYHAEELQKRGWHVDIIYTVENTSPPLKLSEYNIAFNPNALPSPLDRKLKGKLVRGIYGHKWAWSYNPRKALDKALNGSVALIVPNRTLYTMISWYFPKTYQISEGTDTNLFKFLHHRVAPRLVAGWTGDPKHTWKRLEKIVRPACIKADVELRVASNLTREQLVDFYNDLDLVLVASTEEGSPNAVFEAGSCGRTVIGTAAGIIPEAIIDGKTGFIVDGTIESFAAKLRWCKENINIVRKMGLLHRDVVLSKYTVQHEANNFANLMTEILAIIQQEKRLSFKLRKAILNFRETARTVRRRLIMKK